VGPASFAEVVQNLCSSCSGVPLAIMCTPDADKMAARNRKGMGVGKQEPRCLEAGGAFCV
jgi:hypothetical protein